MKTLAIIAVTLSLSGCGTNGVPLLLANYYNNADPCQSTRNGKPAPDWCGGGTGRQMIYLAPNGGQGRAIGYIQK